MGRQFSFIHTGDLHLGAPFSKVSARDERVATALVEATYSAMDRIVTTAIERQVDFILIAGDVYNSRDKNMRAQLRFREAMLRLEAAGIRAYLVHGNHDPEDGFSVGLEMPANVRYLSSSQVERVEITDESGQTLCALYGQSFGTSAVTANLALGFSRQQGDETAIGMLHANVSGQRDYEPYAPCSLQDLRSAEMDYWALGHIHKGFKLADVPRIRYCGSPQGLNPKEDDTHGCWVVTMQAGRVIDEEFVETDAVRWAADAIDASQMKRVDEVIEAVRRSCERARKAAGGRPVIMRLDVAGRTEVNSAIARGTEFDEIVDELRRQQMNGNPWLWLDRVRDRTHPVFDIELLKDVGDFTGEMVRYTEELIAIPMSAKKFLDEALEGVDKVFTGSERDEEYQKDLILRARDVSLRRLILEDD